MTEQTDQRFSVRRTALLLVTAIALIWVAGVMVFSIVDLAAQVSSGSIRTTLYWNGDSSRFTDTGDGSPTAPRISGAGGPVVVTVVGLAFGVVALHLVAEIVTLLPQVALGVVAVRLLARLMRGAPFAGAAARESAIAAVALIVLALVGAFLAWVERLVISQASGSLTFAPVFAIDPTMVTVAFIVLLVAAAFRSGQQLHREVEGLV